MLKGRTCMPIFYFTEPDIGKNEAVACCNKLQKLNAGVAVSVSAKSKISQQHLFCCQAISLMPNFLGNDGTSKW